MINSKQYCGIIYYRYTYIIIYYIVVHVTRRPRDAPGITFKTHGSGTTRTRITLFLFGFSLPRHRSSVHRARGLYRTYRASFGYVRRWSRVLSPIPDGPADYFRRSHPAEHWTTPEKDR